MKKYDVIRMAFDAGFTTAHDVWPKEFQRFAALVAAAEREACIDIVAMHGGSVEIEAAIRSRRGHET